MKKNQMIISVLLFALTSTASEVSVGDSTETMLQSMLAQGGEQALSFTENQVTATYYITGTAKKLITSKTFDTPDPDFSVTEFNQYIKQTLTWAIVYYSSNFNTPVNEIHVAIDDLGDFRKGTVCETYVNTRYIHCDFRRVHKMYKGFKSFLFPMVLVHEYTHANQYALSEYRDVPLTSSTEGRPLAHDRELKAIAVEISAMIAHDGNENAYGNYARSFSASCTESAYNLADETMLKQTGRRCLMLGLWTINNQQGLPGGIDFVDSLKLLSESAEIGFTSLNKIIPGFTFQNLKDETLKLFP